MLLIKAEEIRCKDGKGSWRRNGVSIVDRYLLDVFQSKVFNNKEDFIFLPKGLEIPFTNKIFSEVLSISVYKARK